MLELRDVVCCYGPVTALKGVSLTVCKGQLVALIGANGAGKTTTLKAISGLLHPTAGTIVFEGHDITRSPARAILSLGIAHCPEGRHVFPQMTVLENLEMGCYLRTDRREIAADLARIFEQFPRLAERRHPHVRETTADHLHPTRVRVVSPVDWIGEVTWAQRRRRGWSIAFAC